MPQSNKERLHDLANQLHTAKKAQTAAKEIASEISDALLELMDQMGETVANHDDGKFTIVESSVLEYDEAGIKKALGAKGWGTITRTVMDKKLLEAQIAAGNIDPVVIAQCTTEVPRSRYLRSGGSATPKPTNLRKQMDAAKPEAVTSPGKRRKTTRGRG